jgi:hypothetical protein
VHGCQQGKVLLRVKQHGVCAWFGLECVGWLLLCTYSGSKVWSKCLRYAVRVVKCGQSAWVMP